MVREQLVTAKIRDELRALGRYMIDNQLVWGSSGNISARIGEDRFLISASGAWLGDLGPEDLVERRISGTRAVENGNHPRNFLYIRLSMPCGRRSMLSFIPLPFTAH